MNMMVVNLQPQALAFAKMDFAGFESVGEDILQYGYNETVGIIQGKRTQRKNAWSKRSFTIWVFVNLMDGFSLSPTAGRRSLSSVTLCRSTYLTPPALLRFRCREADD